MRIGYVCLLAILLAGLIPFKANAEELPKLSVELISPAKVQGFPGIEQMINAKITNNTDAVIPDVMAYITMAFYTEENELD